LDLSNHEIYTNATHEAEIVAKAINSWIAYLKKAKIGINEPGSNPSIQETQTEYVIEETSDQY
jgi:hypothetical protein